MLVIYFRIQSKSTIPHLETIIISENNMYGFLCFYIRANRSGRIAQFAIEWRLVINAAGQTEQHIHFPIRFYGNLRPWAENGLCCACDAFSAYGPVMGTNPGV